MSKYRVAVNGLNCQVDVNGHLLRMGFYTARYVEAADAVEAAERAVQMIREFDEFKVKIRNEDRDPPVVVAEEIEEIETFDDIGDVTLFIQDLRTRWVFEQERNREFVTEEEAVLTREVRGLPVKPSEIRQYITDPSKRIQWQEGLTGVDRVTGGRLELGTVSHCVHGPESFLERVIDWRPFAYITTETEVRGTEDTVKLTTLIDELEDGTRVIYRAWAAPDVWSVIEAGFTAGLDSNNARLADLIANDLAESGALAT